VSCQGSPPSSLKESQEQSCLFFDLSFLQAQEAAIQGIKRLHGLGIATRRPDDYFAEMAKSDEHMKKVRFDWFFFQMFLL
jgi:hypothetical protein